MESRNPVIRHAEKQYAEESAASGGAGFAYGEGRSAYAQASGQVPPPPPPVPPGAPIQPSVAGQAGSAAPTADQLRQMYQAPAVAGPGARKMTLDDVIVKTGVCFALLLVGAVGGWFTAESMPYLWIGAAIIGLVLGLVNSFKRNVSPALVLVYAGVQGVFLGGISYWYQTLGVEYGNSNLVLQAVIGTLTAFLVMLALYKTEIIKVNGTFKKVMLVAMVSYGAIALVSFVAALFGVGGGWGFYGVGFLGIALAAVGVLLAAFCLCLDFEAIRQGIQYGVPERESWRMSFGLLITLIWLYLEILRLLLLIAASTRD